MMSAYDSMHLLSLLLALVAANTAAVVPGKYTGPFGSRYPVTAAWFKDRYTDEGWNKTLTEFAEVGGDTVLLRAPSITIVVRDELAYDPDFQWCRGQKNPAQTCYDEITSDLSQQGVKAEAFATYKYEENYSDQALIQCPQYERKIVGSRTYFILVLPVKYVLETKRCDFTDMPVLVLLITFSGIDPHEQLLRNAQQFNMSVYFGLPQPMVDYKHKQIYPVMSYFAFVERLLHDHKIRFAMTNNSSLYTVLKGYTFSYDFSLLDVNEDDANVLNTLTWLSKEIHSYDKELLVSTYFNSLKTEKVASLEDYTKSFEVLANIVDVISVKDGRGSGVGAYFWPTQKRSLIKTTDEGLYEILRENQHGVGENTTFDDIFWTSVHQMFYSLSQTRDNIVHNGGSVDLWLNIEAYDMLHDDPCLPIDISGSGMDQMLNRITKSRLDQSLTNAGVFVQKVAATAWDPGFTCETSSHPSPLWKQIKVDSDRPIMTNCSFHTYYNRSVVIIGYNLDGLTQGFTVDWPNVDGHRVVSTDVHGYYFELDWGIAHQRVPSLMYTQLYDPYNVMQLAPKGYVTIKVNGGYHGCAFTYDFTTMDLPNNTDLETKRHYKSVKAPHRRIYGQDTPF